MKKENKKRLVPFLCAGMLAAGVTGGAMALLTDTDTAKTNQVITAGTFTISFKDEKSAINDAVAYPTLEAEGLKSTPYEFTVSNDGTINQVVRLGLNATPGSAGTELDGSKVRVVITEAVPGLDGSGAQIYNGTLADIDSEKVPFGAGKVKAIDAGQSQKYELRAWVDENATNDDLYGVGGDEIRGVNFTVEAYGVQKDGGAFTSPDQWDTEFQAVAQANQ